MTSDGQPRLDGTSLRFGRLAFLFADGFAAAVAGFSVIDATLLRTEGYLPLWGALLIYGAILAWIIGADRMYRRLGLVPKDYGRRVRPSFYALCFLIGGVILPRWFVYRESRKGYSNLWYTMDWHRLPMDFVLYFRTDPWLVILVVLAFIALAQWAVLRRRWTGVASIFLGCFVLVWFRGIISVHFEWTDGLTHFSFPLIPLPFAVLARRPILSIRLATATGLFILLPMNYMGFTTLADLTGAKAPEQAAVHRVYPPAHEEPDFPQLFYRSVVVDPDDRWAVLSYGPTSGFVRVRIEDGRIEDWAPIHGMIRFVYERPGTHDLYGINAKSQDLVIAKESPLAIKQQIDLASHGLSTNPVAYQFDWQRDRFYVAEYDRGLVSEYRLSDDARLRTLSFFDLGMSHFRSGVYQLALDADRHRLYVAFGITDALQHYGVAAIDLDTWAVVWHLDAPLGGWGFMLTPEGDRLISSDFFGRRVLEIDAAHGVVRREMEAPLCTRAMEYDRERKVIYFLGFGDGVLSALDDATGKTLWSRQVGPKATALGWSEKAQALYTASGWGLNRVDVCALFGTSSPALRSSHCPPH